ncbi:MAG: hypothetical protein H7Y38_05590 [Armatimonadetes bacterium]|nr:hypothetical protein [Armatimonadota bacterium]
MNQRSFCRIAALAAAFFVCLPVFAQNKPASPTVKPTAQLDGIEYRVVDRVWANVDGYFHEGDYNRVVALCRVCVESDPDFDEANSAASWILWSMGDKPAANALLARGTARATKKWLAEYTFAENLMVRREYKDALPHLISATKNENAPVIVWKQLAHAYDKTGNLPKSLATWDYVVKKFPNEPSAANNRSRVAKKIAESKPGR